MGKEILAERGRALEEEYSRKKDKKLIEKIRRTMTATEAYVEMGKKTDLINPGML